MCYTCGSGDYILPEDIEKMIEKGRLGVAAKITDLPPDQYIDRFRAEIAKVRERTIHFWYDAPEKKRRARKAPLSEGALRPPSENVRDLKLNDRRVLFGMSVELDARLDAWEHYFKTQRSYMPEQLRSELGEENYAFLRFGHPERPGDSRVEELKMFARHRLLTRSEKKQPGVFEAIDRQLEAMTQFADTTPTSPNRPKQNANLVILHCAA